MPRQSITAQFHRLKQSLSSNKSWTLWEGWVGVMAIAELIGLGIALVGSAIVNSLGMGSAVVVFHLVGLLEGIVLGVAQWLILHRYVKRIRAWIFVTAIATLLAWLIGLQVSALLVFSTTLNPALTAATKAQIFLKGVLFLGAWVGGVLGLAQWFVLKAHIRQAALWIVANAFAWSLGLVIAFVMLGMVHTQPSSLEAALAGAATGLTTGAVVGAITGIALIWLLKPRLLQRD